MRTCIILVVVVFLPSPAYAEKNDFFSPINYGSEVADIPLEDLIREFVFANSSRSPRKGSQSGMYRWEQMRQDHAFTIMREISVAKKLSDGVSQLARESLGSVPDERAAKALIDIISESRQSEGVRTHAYQCLLPHVRRASVAGCEFVALTEHDILIPRSIREANVRFLDDAGTLSETAQKVLAEKRKGAKAFAIIHAKYFGKVKYGIPSFGAGNLMSRGPETFISDFRTGQRNPDYAKDGFLRTDDAINAIAAIASSPDFEREIVEQAIATLGEKSSSDVATDRLGDIAGNADLPDRVRVRAREALELHLRRDSKRALKFLEKSIESPEPLFSGADKSLLAAIHGDLPISVLRILETSESSTIRANVAAEYERLSSAAPQLSLEDAHRVEWENKARIRMLELEIAQDKEILKKNLASKKLRGVNVYYHPDVIKDRIKHKQSVIAHLRTRTILNLAIDRLEEFYDITKVSQKVIRDAAKLNARDQKLMELIGKMPVLRITSEDSDDEGDPQSATPTEVDLDTRFLGLTVTYQLWLDEAERREARERALVLQADLLQFSKKSFAAIQEGYQKRLFERIAKSKPASPRR